MPTRKDLTDKELVNKSVPRRRKKVKVVKSETFEREIQTPNKMKTKVLRRDTLEDGRVKQYFVDCKTTGSKMKSKIIFPS